MLIDTHTHLYSEEFEADIDTVIERATQAGIEKMYLPAIDRSTADKMFALEIRFPGKCISMMGLHPCSVKENYEEELFFIENQLNHRAFAAIGETGLDFYWDRTFEAQQYIAFKQQLQWALDRQLPIVIHTRNAMQEAIDTVRPYAAQGLTGIFHCFTGDPEAATAITAMGFYLGIGGVLTYKNSDLPAVLQGIDLNHLVLETDSPYLPPVPYRGKRNESSYLSYIAEKLASVKNVSLEEVASVTTANAQKIFGN